MTPEQKKLLQPHADHYQEMMTHIYEATDDELDALLAACRSVSTTNCAWNIYAAAGWMLPKIMTEQARRERVKANP